MQRPLIKRVNDEQQWIMSVQEIPHVRGISYPVFEWSFGQKDDLRGGELRAWPLQGILVFTDRRDSKDFSFDSVENALEKIDEYGWGEPPHIDEVFWDIRRSYAEFPVGSLEKAKQIFGQLRQKWNALDSS